MMMTNLFHVDLPHLLFLVTCSERKIMAAFHGDQDPELINRNLDKWDEFLTSTLRPKLQSLMREKKELERDVAAYEELSHFLESLSSTENSLSTEVEVRECSGVRVPANVTQSGRIFVDVGLGFHPEFTREEATSVAKTIGNYRAQDVIKVNDKIEQLQREIWTGMQTAQQLKESLDKSV